jgi:hypothetical protein
MFPALSFDVTVYAIQGVQPNHSFDGQFSSCLTRGTAYNGMNEASGGRKWQTIRQGSGAF